MIRDRTIGNSSCRFKHTEVSMDQDQVIAVSLTDDEALLKTVTLLPAQ